MTAIRGADAMQASLFMVAKPGDFVPEDHTLCTERQLVNAALVEMKGRFNEDTAADGFGGRRAAVGMLDALPATSSRHSVGADKGCDTADFVTACRDRNVMPHIACHDTRIGGSPIDGRTASHPCHRLSPIRRKRTGKRFGPGRTIRRIHQSVYRGLERVDQRRTHPPRVCAIDGTTRSSLFFRHFSPACQGA